MLLLLLVVWSPKQQILSSQGEKKGPNSSREKTNLQGQAMALKVAYLLFPSSCDFLLPLGLFLSASLFPLIFVFASLSSLLFICH